MFPPNLSSNCLNNFFRTSIPTFNSALLNFLARFIVFSFPCFFTSNNILLCIASNISGTQTNTDTLYSFIFSCICLSPSQNTLRTPLFNINIIPVEPNVWWNGNITKLTSVLYNFSAAFIECTFDAIFFWDNITALESDVVPDVNNIILVFSGSIFNSKNSLFPLSSSSFPIFFILGILFISFDSTSFIQINSFAFVVDLCFISSIISIYFGSNIRASASLLIIESSISWAVTA